MILMFLMSLGFAAEEMTVTRAERVELVAKEPALGLWLALSGGYWIQLTPSVLMRISLGSDQ